MPIITMIPCKRSNLGRTDEADSRHHGWAAARANLKNEENKKQFEDVYKRLADFFAKTH
jgi:dienelactone hydrolase